MWIQFNPNPTGRSVEDCAVRAIAKALDIDWESAYTLMAVNGYAMGDMPHADSVWGAILRQNGFYRKSIPNSCPDCYTISDFARDNPVGTFVLGTGRHVVTVEDGDVWDAWNSLSEIPIYVWYRKD